MSTAYSDNYSLLAGMLALFVHGVFFALLYFGFTWQNQQPVVMSVQLWQSLPDDVAEPVVQPKVTPPPVKYIEPEVKPVPQPVVVKPDIVLPTKKPVPKPVEAKPVEKVVEKIVAKPKPPEVKTPPKPAQPSAQELEIARLQAEQAAQAAAVGKVVDEYSGKIHDKIRRNIAGDLSSVPKDALAIFSVTLLPGGTVLSARLTQSSGNALYDNAVERAILKSQPLPLPPDPNMFNRFRELRLKFKPNE
jgi:colicin import membrane protein